MKKISLLLLFFSVFIFSAFAQDAENCKDHPMFDRMPGYFIAECAANFENVPIMMADGNEKQVGGKTTYIYYAPREGNKQLPSFSQVVKYYEKITGSHDGKKIFSNAEQATIKMKSSDNKDIWLSIRNWESTNGIGFYDLSIVEEN